MAESSEGGGRASPSQPGESDGWRRWLPWVLIVLAAIIGLVAALNVWVKREALSTNNWTNASGRLLENPEIRNAVSVYLVDQLYQNVNVGKAISGRLPKQVQGIGPPLAAALEPQLVKLTSDVLGRPRVQQLWKEANRRAHQAFMNLLNSKYGLLQTTNGNVVLDLGAVLEQLVKEIGFGQRLVSRLPPDAGQIVVLKGSQLDTARKSVKVIRVLSYLLAFLMLALFAAAVYIARTRRRRTLMAVGVSLLIVGLLILLVRRLAGNYVVDALTSNLDTKRAVSATWAIGTELLRNVGINVLVYGAGIVFAAWIAGPSRPAVWVRRVSAPTIRDRPYILYAVVTSILLVVLVTGPTDATRVYPLLVLFALAFVGTEVLRRQTLREFPPAESRQTAPG